MRRQRLLAMQKKILVGGNRIMEIAFNEPFKGFGGMYVEEINWSPDGEVTISGELIRIISRAKPYDKLILNPPATIVIWNDGTKTVVKCTDGDSYDPEKGVAICFMKKHFPKMYKQIFKDTEDAWENYKEWAVRSLKRGYKKAAKKYKYTKHDEEIAEAVYETTQRNNGR